AVRMGGRPVSNLTSTTAPITWAMEPMLPAPVNSSVIFEDPSAGADTAASAANWRNPKGGKYGATACGGALAQASGRDALQALLARPPDAEEDRAPCRSRDESRRLVAIRTAYSL
ncbi:hypothetical protein GOP47_0030803, partial [Adiantum capillus-veneris]